MTTAATLLMCECTSKEEIHSLKARPEITVMSSAFVIITEMQGITRLQVSALSLVYDAVS